MALGELVGVEQAWLRVNFELGLVAGTWPVPGWNGPPMLDYPGYGERAEYAW